MRERERERTRAKELYSFCVMSWCDRQSVCGKMSERILCERKKRREKV